MEEGVFLEGARAFIPSPDAFRMQVSSRQDPVPQQALEGPHPGPVPAASWSAPFPHIPCVLVALATHLSDSGSLQVLSPCLECCSLCPLPGYF